MEEEIKNQKDLLHKKEYRITEYQKNKDSSIENLFGNKFQYTSYQTFGANYFNPYNLRPNRRRILVKYGTGSGKSLFAIGAASRFIETYRDKYLELRAKRVINSYVLKELDMITPSVFILGFGGTHTAFTRDLLKYPEFGFISEFEKEELRQTKDKKAAKDYLTNIKKRLKNKELGGFYKFLGYQELLNRLFVLKSDISFIDLETETVLRQIDGEDVVLDDIVHEKLAANEIQINRNFLRRFDDSLIICDEVQELYNSNMMNNYGVAIQYILDTCRNCAAIFLSATILNNSPTEIVDIMNLLCEDPKSRMRKQTIFQFDGNVKTAYGMPQFEEDVKYRLRGKVLFLQDTNQNRFPQRIIEGEEVGGIPYLNFIKCNISEYHLATIKYLQTSGDFEREEENMEKSITQLREKLKELRTIKKMSLEAQISSKIKSADQLKEQEILSKKQLKLLRHFTMKRWTSVNSLSQLAKWRIPLNKTGILDGVFPNPRSEEYGLIETKKVKAAILEASEEWKSAVGIEVVKVGTVDPVFQGRFASAENVGKYSAKYSEMLRIVLDVCRKNIGNAAHKIFIYHDKVKNMGILFAEQVLINAGFINDEMKITSATMCAYCGWAFSDHELNNERAEVREAGKHNFIAAKYAIVHNHILKSQFNYNIERFQSPANVHGFECKILLGSQIMQVSRELPAVQTFIILTLPTNIPTLLQVFGRCIRIDSHILLPPEQRKVHIYILLSAIAGSADSPEITRYKEKMADYKNIQTIEKFLHEIAVDGYINRRINMTIENLGQYFPALRPEDFDVRLMKPLMADIPPKALLGHLYFEPEVVLSEKEAAESLDIITYNAYRYFEREIDAIIVIIKRMFIESPIWTYEELFAIVKDPPFAIEMNMSYVSEDNFKIALRFLIEMSPLQNSRIIKNIYDPQMVYIYKNGGIYKIKHMPPNYFVLFPMNNRILSSVYDAPDSFIRSATVAADMDSFDIKDFIDTIKQKNIAGSIVDKIESITNDPDKSRDYLGAFDYETHKLFSISILLAAYFKDKTFLKKFGGIISIMRQMDLLFTKKDLEEDSRLNVLNAIYKKAANRTIADDEIVAAVFDGKINCVGGPIEENSPPKVASLADYFEIAKSRPPPFGETDFSVIDKRKEADIIGFYSSKQISDAGFKLKLIIKQKGKSRDADKRKQEKGLDCYSKEKADLKNIADSLGAKISGTKKEQYCAAILDKLIENEMNKKGGLRWFYAAETFKFT